MATKWHIGRKFQRMAERVKVLVAVEMEEKYLGKSEDAPRLEVIYLSFQKRDQVIEDILPYLADTNVLFPTASFDLAAAP